MGKRTLILSLVITSIFLLLPSSTRAQDNNTITVSGYNFPRNRYSLVNTSGGPPNTIQTSSNLYGNLLNTSNFGNSGVVNCSVQISPFVDYIYSNSLLDSNNNLTYDIFFAGASENQALSTEEIEELAKFIEKGGVVYLYGSGNPPPSDPIGMEFNPLFERLGLDNTFTADRINPGSQFQTASSSSSIITNGPFGNVSTLRYQTIRKLDNNYSMNLVSSTGTETNEWGLVYEKRIGKGYLIVTTSPLYVNGFMGDNDNKNYFLNLFSLGCNDDWRSEAEVLTVPSFKQGISPYDDSSPYWENYGYDNATSNNTLRLGCDIDQNGATIGECGCALTSASMVAKYLGVKKLPDMTSMDPDNLNYLLAQDLDYVASRGYSYGSINWITLGNLSSKANEKFKEWYGENSGQQKIIYSKRMDYDVDSIKEYIDNKQPVIVKVNGPIGDHWVVVTGYDEDSGKLIMNDPAYPDPISDYVYLQDRYTPVIDSSVIVYAKTNSDYRYLQVVTTTENEIKLTDINGNPLENIDNAVDGPYANPITTLTTPVVGSEVRFITLKEPEDGDYKIEVTGNDGVPHPFAVYTSNINGDYTYKSFVPDTSHKKYLLKYQENLAGEEINMEVINDQIEVQVDVKQSNINVHKLMEQPLPVPVVIFSDESFDVSLIDKSSLTLGRIGTEESLIKCQTHYSDFNEDNLPDLFCLFDARKMDIDEATDILVLNGKAEDMTVIGSDNIKYH